MVQAAGLEASGGDRQIRELLERAAALLARSPSSLASPSDLLQLSVQPAALSGPTPCEPPFVAVPQHSLLPRGGTERPRPRIAPSAGKPESGGGAGPGPSSAPGSAAGRRLLDLAAGGKGANAASPRPSPADISPGARRPTSVPVAAAQRKRSDGVSAAADLKPSLRLGPEDAPRTGQVGHVGVSGKGSPPGRTLDGRLPRVPQGVKAADGRPRNPVPARKAPPAALPSAGKGTNWRGGSEEGTVHHPREESAVAVSGLREAQGQGGGVSGAYETEEGFQPAPVRMSKVRMLGVSVTPLGSAGGLGGVTAGASPASDYAPQVGVTNRTCTLNVINWHTGNLVCCGIFSIYLAASLLSSRRLWKPSQTSTERKAYCFGAEVFGRVSMLKRDCSLARPVCTI